jgi:cell division protein FtsB
MGSVRGDGRLDESPNGWGDVWLRGLPLAVLTVSLIAVPVLLLQPQGLPRMRALEQELRSVEAENAELRRDVARLRNEVKELRDNPAAVERIAREQLGLVRKSEVVFQFEKR